MERTEYIENIRPNMYAMAYNYLVSFSPLAGGYAEHLTRVYMDNMDNHFNVVLLHDKQGELIKVL